MNNTKGIIGEKVFHHKIRWMWDECIRNEYMDRNLLRNYMNTVMSDLWFTDSFRRRIIMEGRHHE